MRSTQLLRAGAILGAAAGTGLLLAGEIALGLAVGSMAVALAWLRTTAPQPPEQG